MFFTGEGRLKVLASACHRLTRPQQRQRKNCHTAKSWSCTCKHCRSWRSNLS